MIHRQLYALLERIGIRLAGNKPIPGKGALMAFIIANCVLRTIDLIAVKARMKTAALLTTCKVLCRIYTNSMSIDTQRSGRHTLITVVSSRCAYRTGEGDLVKAY